MSEPEKWLLSIEHDAAAKGDLGVAELAAHARARIARLHEREAEIERLRAALREIAHSSRASSAVIKIAREALDV